MPNPLIGSRPLNVGKRADDRPHAVPPTPEAYEGDNNAYRGTNDHGVPSRSLATAIDDDEWEDATSGEFVIEKEPTAPVPVVVVKEFTRELRRFVARQVPVPAVGVVQLCGRNNARSRVLISTLTAPFIVGDTESVTSYMGYNVSAGLTNNLSLTTEDPVFACSPDGITGSVAHVIEEFVVRER